MKEKWKVLLSFVPEANVQSISWDKIEESELRFYIANMKQTDQNPKWHGEGDVWTHTKMVCEELIRLPAYQQAKRHIQIILFLACLFHDFGKIPCTKLENGVWVSPHHTLTGSKMVREILWETYGLCGKEELQKMRETICLLIRYHSVPVHILEQNSYERRLLKIAANGELLPDFSLNMLGILVEADLKGRIHENPEESMELLDLFREAAKEHHCYDGPYPFQSAYSKYAYLSGKDILPDQELYDDSWKEVIMIAGMPGTGKDTFIKEHFGDIPMLSLDEIRKELHISATENQGAVVQKAKEQAKAYLRNRQRFVYNATNLTPMIRSKWISLFHDYKASVRVIFLETNWEEEQRRNENRKEEVPKKVIRDMLKNLVLPEVAEAQNVEWRCI